jgi:hypothetical protein
MRYRLWTLTILLAASVGLVPRAQAGPPLICHPFEIGAARSLPWSGGKDWHSPSPSYDTKQLIPDTLALLDAKTPVIVRMETLRRAAIYSSKQPGLAYELLSRLMGRALSAAEDHKSAALAWFDAGYLVETYRQAGWQQKPNLVEGLDGYDWTLKAIQLGGGSAEMEFAASLIKSHSAWPNLHLKKAQTAAAQGSLLARNLERYKDR